MPIRDFRRADRDAVLALAADFYTGPGVLHPIPVSHFAAVFDEMCDGGSSRLRGLAVEEGGVLAGYCSLAFSYSTEAGGPVVLIEELYIHPDFRARGLGEAVLRQVQSEYRGKAARLRLEVAPGNGRAQALYARLGFHALPYAQMVCEDF